MAKELELKLPPGNQALIKLPALLLALLLLKASATFAAAEQTVIRFDTADADTWTFDRQVAGAVQAESCDVVNVRSSTGVNRAQLRKGRFAALIHLRSG